MCQPNVRGFMHATTRDRHQMIHARVRRPDLLVADVAATTVACIDGRGIYRGNELGADAGTAPMPLLAVFLGVSGAIGRLIGASLLAVRSMVRSSIGALLLAVSGVVGKSRGAGVLAVRSPISGTRGACLFKVVGSPPTAIMHIAEPALEFATAAALFDRADDNLRTHREVPLSGVRRTAVNAARPPSILPEHGAAKCLIVRCERQAASTGLCVPCDRFYRVVLADDRFRSERPTRYDPRSGQMVLC